MGSEKKKMKEERQSASEAHKRKITTFWVE
jgi:hypothetical protein